MFLVSLLRQSDSSGRKHPQLNTIDGCCGQNYSGVIDRARSAYAHVSLEAIEEFNHSSSPPPFFLHSSLVFRYVVVVGDGVLPVAFLPCSACTQRDGSQGTGIERHACIHTSNRPFAPLVQLQMGGGGQWSAGFFGRLVCWQCTAA